MLTDSRPQTSSSATLPLLVAGIALVLNVLLALSYPLIDPDEGRNAEIARDMAANGDLVIPHLAGMPYLDKPPALFWLASLPIRAFGPTPWAARLPAAFAGAITLALIAAAAQRHRGTRFALTVTLLLAAAPLFAVLSAYVIFDLLLGLCVTIVWLGLAAELEHGVSSRRRLLMFAAVTLGILVKGPVMLAWMLGGTLGAALMLRSIAPLRWLAWLPGWAIVLGIAGGWFALASGRHPEYPRYAFLEESYERLTTKSFERDQPAWFVPAVLAGGALPWSLATPWARPMSVVASVGLGFVLFAAVFFTASHSKLVTYLVPCLPPLAWLAAEAWSDPRRARRGAWVAGALLAILALGIAIAGTRADTSKLGLDVAPSAVRLTIGLGLAAALALAGGVLRRPALTLAALVAFVPLLFLCAGTALVAYAETQSGAALARAIATAEPGGRVRYEHCYSPGTDYLRSRISDLVSPKGGGTTSVYQSRYRESLIARGMWTPVANASMAPTADVIVRRANNDSLPPAGMEEFFHDRRFKAFQRVTR